MALRMREPSLLVLVVAILVVLVLMVVGGAVLYGSVMNSGPMIDN